MHTFFNPVSGAANPTQLWPMPHGAVLKIRLDNIHTVFREVPGTAWPPVNPGYRYFFCLHVNSVQMNYGRSSKPWIHRHPSTCTTSPWEQITYFLSPSQPAEPSCVRNLFLRVDYMLDVKY